MNFRQLLAVALTAATTCLSAAAIAAPADALQRAKTAGVLQVATEEQFAPYDFNDNGKHVGINVDVFAEIGKELGLKIEYTDLPWTSVLPGLEAKKYDVVAGPAAINAERAARFRFLIPIDENTTMILKRKGDTAVTKSEDIAGKKIGSQRASSPLATLKAYAATLGKAPSIVEYVDFNQAYADLAAGRLDGVANGSTNTLYAATKRPDVFEAVVPGFGPPHYSSFLGRKDDDSKTLLDAIDAALLKIQKDGRMKAIQTKWYGRSFPLPDHVPAP